MCVCVCRSVFGGGEIGSSRKSPVLALGWSREPSLHRPYSKSLRFPHPQASGSESHSVCRSIPGPARVQPCLRRAAPGAASRRPGGKWQQRSPFPLPHTSPRRDPRLSRPQAPGLQPPLGAQPGRRSEEERAATGLLPRRGRRGLRSRRLQRAFLMQVAQLSERARLTGSREKLILGLDLPAAQRAKPLLHFFPFLQLLTLKRTIPGQAGPDHLCLLPLL